MKPTLEIMRQDLNDHFELSTYPQEFKDVILKNKIDELIFIAYLEEETDKTFLKWVSETPMKKFIYNLYLLNAKSKIFEIVKQPGFVKIKIEVNFKHLIIDNIHKTLETLVELIQAKYKGYEIYFED